ncbi:hypothetical protein FRC07_009535, partial [Ceratobasidium sp. 392]
MSATFDHFPGKVILHAQFTAQEGQADKVQDFIKAIQADISAGKEPGALTYRLARNGNDFLTFEEYESPAAVKAHSEVPKYQAFSTAVQSGTLLVG